MRIFITEVLSANPILLHNGQTCAYRVRFTSDVVAGQARFIPSNRPAGQMQEQQYCVEARYEWIENVRIWTPPDVPSPQMVPRARAEDYDLVARIVAMTPPTDDSNPIVDAVVGDSTFAFTVHELDGVIPRVGDVITCTVKARSLWDVGL